MTKLSHLEPDCRFCAIARGHAFHGPADRPVSSVRDYLTIASIGALVEGWSLVLPRDHCLSLRDFYAVASFSDFLRHTVKTVEASYGHSVIFEHGANHRGSLTNCGTDHGHLHIVPLPFSLSDVIGRSVLASWEPVRTSVLREEVGDSEYLFFSEEPSQLDPPGYLRVLRSPVSQFFRRVIASQLGATEVADYRKYPFLRTAERTHERLAPIA
jgi:hypothetical protein